MRRLVSVTAVVCLVVAGCGGDDGGGGPNGASDAPMRVAYSSALDPNDIADQIGLRAAKAKVQTVSDDSGVVAGLLRRSIDVGNVDFDAAVKAKVGGVPIKVIYVSQAKPEYVFVSRPAITSPQQLAGKKVGFHARGTQTDTFVRSFVRQQAPDVYDKVNFLGLEESSRRAQAMVSKRLDASALEAINLAQLEKQGDYHALGTWANLTGPAEQVLGTAWIVTEEFYAKNKERLTEFVKTLQRGYDRFYRDKAGWLTLARSVLPDVEQSLLPAVYDVYKRQSMYPRAGRPAITPAIFKANEEFARGLGEWEDEQDDSLIAYDLVRAGAGGGA